jgi:anti-anti-sigma factor
MSRRPDSTGLMSRPRHVVAPGFRCSTTPGAGNASFVLAAGELDLAVAPLVEEVLEHAARRSRLVVVDLREVIRLDSSGVGALVQASVAARRAGSRLVLIRGRSQIDRLLALTGEAVETIDLDFGEPATKALLHISQGDGPSGRVTRRVARRVATFILTRSAAAQRTKDGELTR